mmetsp:Transcript_20144/g.28873  ORF Transcript_20144/g.28873 Transcript_20144/m.28873 type:complete len:278 (+) Transcript_20144:76-909(+)
MNSYRVRSFCIAVNKEKFKVQDKIGIVVFSSICIGTFSLGVWQIQRYHWKTNKIDSMKDSLSCEPVDALTLNNDFSKLNGRRIKIKGYFDHSKELKLGLRSAPVSLAGSAQGLAMNAQGYYIITPFIREDGTKVFVNRGWVPKRVDTDNSFVYRPTQIMSIVCTVSNEEKSGSFAPVNDPKTGNLYWLEGKALQQHIGEGDDKPQVILEATADSSLTDRANSPVVFPFARDVSEMGEHHIAPITHLVYAVTWFSLSAAGFFMTYLKFRKGRINRRFK